MASLSPALREELTLWRHDTAYPDKTDYVLPTSTGKRQHESNLRRDVLRPAVAAANECLERLGIAPIGAVTFHRFRTTYSALREACGDTMTYTADQLGHRDSRFTQRVSRQAVGRRDRMAKLHLREYDWAREWALLGTSETISLPAFHSETTEVAI